LGKVIGIAGTPGTGKKSVAPLVASMLGVAPLNLPPLPPNAASATVTGETEIDTAKARRDIQRLRPHDVVAYGHLLPYILPPVMVSHVVVLRCEPMVLRKRLSNRGYPSRKIIDNVEAELIGVIASDAMDAFGRGKTVEFDTTTSSAAHAAGAIVRLIRTGRPAAPRIDWMPSYGSARKLRSLLSLEVPRRG
jgi:adenylate kinase